MTFQEIKNKLKSPIIWCNLLAMLIVVTALLIGLRYWLGAYTHHGEEIAVPNVTNQTSDDASILLEQEGLYAVVEDSTYDPKRPVGVVISQRPVAGSKVKMGREVMLIINRKDCPERALPDLVENCSEREAIDRLKALGFTLAEPERVRGDKGWIMGMKCQGRNVGGGDKVPTNAPITLVIGNGFGGDDDDWDDDGSAETDEDIYSE